MNINTYKRVQVIISLEQSEEFLAVNDSGYEFFVRQITYTPGADDVGLRGFAKKRVDGSRGGIERTVGMPLEEFIDTVATSGRIIVAILKQMGSVV